MQPGDIQELTLYRGPCFGTCPVFSFSANSKGRYTYDGRCYVEPVGERAGRFPNYLFARLAEVCIELRVLELDDLYQGDFEDASSVLVKVRHAGGVKVVRSEGGAMGPVRLWAFESLIEVAMREAFEIEDRQVGGRGTNSGRKPGRR